MIARLRVLALDGHDGVGKTTLASSLAQRLGVRYVAPFSGAAGSELMQAHSEGDAERVLRVGLTAIESALAGVSDAPGVVLDRGWITVSTLVPEALFAQAWPLWLPTTLLWCDLPTTLHRLASRVDDAPQLADWHEQFLRTYLNRRRLQPGPILRTDLASLADCEEQLCTMFAQAPMTYFTQ